MSTFQNPSSANASPISAPLTTSGLPISQLESLKFKSSQIIDSILSLQRTIEAGHMAAMPAWPDILSKYNILLSQTHSFSMGLTGTLSAAAASTSAQLAARGGTAPPAGNLLERVALHPTAPMPDTQLDTEVIPLLRNQQTTDVLRDENETVRRLAEHMTTRGSLGVLGAPPAQQQPPFGMGAKKPVEYADVLRECDEIRDAHDRRVDRAVRAVLMLREKYEWRARVEVEVEEPEELEWDPRVHQQDIGMGEDMGDENGDDENGGGDDEDDAMRESNGERDGDAGMDGDADEDGSSDEDEVQALVDSAMDTQSPASPTVPMPVPSTHTATVSNDGIDIPIDPALS